MGELLFLSYASPDKSRVEPFYDALEEMGLDPWMDCRKLRAGQNWDFEIQRALDQAKIVLVFLSHNSVDRRGYVQKEIKIALRKLEEKLVDDIYIIPVALDEVARPSELSRIQFVDGKSLECLEEIRLAVTEQLGKIGEVEGRATEVEQVSYHRRSYRDCYDGIPGYEVSADILQISSSEYPNVSNASNFVLGEICGSLMSARVCAAEPDPKLYSIGQAKWSRTNTLDWVLSDVTTSGRILSIVYTVHHYGAGAAHPVSGFRSFNFFLSPVFEIASFQSLLEDEGCLNIIQERARKQLAETLGEVMEGEPDLDWIHRGTADWEAFSNFSIRNSEITFYFGSYQVAAYAFGHQSATLSMRDLAPFLTDFAANSLDLGWVKQQAKQP